jgi:two-component system, cell cycle response regulator DivK
MYCVLYVEDDKLSSRLVQKMLKPMGYDTITAEDAATGIHMAVTEMPDIILMDVGLPDMNGYDATRRLKALPEVAHIPVIILTADTTGQVRSACLDAGCDAYLNKPISKLYLLRTIRQLFRPTRRVEY